MATNSSEAQPQGVEPRIRTATIRICQPCVDLVGEECHTPECVFCFHSVTEAKWLMDKMLIAPIIDGERFVLVDDDTRATGERSIAEREFIEASVAVWREIDRLSELPEGYKGLAPETDPRKRELAAWESYRAELDRDPSPRATGETKVQAALAELREISPEPHLGRVFVTQKFCYSTEDKGAFEVWSIEGGILGDVPFVGRTLADCVAQVRAAARTEGGGEK